MSSPHVLLITTDHWPAALLGSAGHPAIQTPTLDEIARWGTQYTNAYSECPVCIPARRTLLTGMNPRSHGDRTFQTTLEMPNAPTIADCFRNAGYQTCAVGKLHVYPQRSRAGFDDVWLAEEGRPHWGVWDDYDTFLGEQGFAGQQFDHAMSNNQYTARPWHLPEKCHVTNWTAQTMSKMIRRRDPTRPGFWYLSFTHPHPPLVPPQHYWDIYQNCEPEFPVYGDWTPAAWRDLDSPTTGGSEKLPYRLRLQRSGWYLRTQQEVATALRAFYALCTHIDHQLRLVIGTLREEGILDDTIIMFTADHGDMLGHHGMWAKRLFYERSANVPMILVRPASQSAIDPEVSDRLTGLQDVMPTLLDAAGIRPPESCDGVSLLSTKTREKFYGECNEGTDATRMLHDGRHKLIYYPTGNCCQLFDIVDDPLEMHDLAASVEHAAILQRLQESLMQELYGSDLDWIQDGKLVGSEDIAEVPAAKRGLALQRGTHWPPAPVIPPKPGETNSGTN